MRESVEIAYHVHGLEHALVLFIRSYQQFVDYGEQRLAGLPVFFDALVLGLRDVLESLGLGDAVMEAGLLELELSWPLGLDLVKYRFQYASSARGEGQHHDDE